MKYKLKPKKSNLTEAGIGAYVSSALGFNRQTCNEIIEFLKAHSGEDPRIPRWIEQLEVHRMNLLGNAFGTVAGGTLGGLRLLKYLGYLK